ncbi:MAG: hypothetical protein EBR79_01160 [Proteobacteria bacterium]|nr:hypothetical protein [Pseudomonadota bacterium]NBX86703.1 hypothetical protein [Pseudomonadota bacterium]
MVRLIVGLVVVVCLTLAGSVGFAASGTVPKVTASKTVSSSKVAAPALSRQDRLVAVVNDQGITLSQLRARSELNLRQLGLASPSAEQRRAVERRALAGMIDEELQRQFAAANGLALTKPEIAKARADARAAAGPAWASLTRGVEAAANDKVAAEVQWQKIVAIELRPRVQVGTAELDQLIEQLAKSRHVLEREISMIMLNPAEGAADREQLAKLQDLRGKITAGANFAEQAKAYSDDKSALNGGRMGWFGSGELNPQLEDALDKLQPGQVSEPIRTPMGWHLIKLENVRTTKPLATTPQTQLELYLLAAPQPADDKAQQALRDKLQTASRNLNTPVAVREYFNKKQFAEGFAESIALGWVTTADLQPELQAALANVKVGRWSDDVPVSGNVARVFVAGTREVLPAKLEEYRERIRTNLTESRLELNARRFMRELRQRAFVDIRL